MIAASDVPDFATSRAMARAGEAQAAALRAAIEARLGGLDGFRRGLRVATLAGSDAAGLDAFYRVLQQGILPDELVPLSDFAEILRTRNADPVMVRGLGKYRYACLVLRDAAGMTIGAMASVYFRHLSGPATLHSSYAALLPAYRGMGLGPMLMEATLAFATDGLGTADLLHFIEINAIANMTLRDRLIDEAIAMHPLDREQYWEARGFRAIAGIDYHQRADPPIPLSLMVRARRGGAVPITSVPGSAVIAHVRAFDSLLLNYAACRARLAAGETLPDPRGEGLLAPFEADADLALLSPQQAEERRRRWRAIDAHLAGGGEWPLDASMAALAARECEML